MTSHSNIEHALKYAELSWFVLPIHPVEKRPLIKWAHRKNQRAASDEIQDWFKKWPDARVGIATGSLSGVNVVDLDGPQAYARFEALYGLPETITQSTGRAEGGQQLFFKYCGNQYLDDAYQLIAARVAAMRTHLSLVPGHTTKSFKEHIDILQSILDNNVAKAIKILDEHITRTKNSAAIHFPKYNV